VVVETGEREYRFAVELIRRWVRNNRPLEEVKNELDRIEPVAERLYEVGRDFFNRQQWEDAVRFFQVALERNPRHFRARLHLGEALLEMGQPDEATGELERAYELDQEEARLPLARALMAQAKAQESAGDEDSALAACERALQISPYERGAQRMQAAIWTRRGDLALEVDDYDAALDNYEKAVAALEDARGLTNERVEAQDKVREAHEQRAKAAEAAEDWDVAAGDYEWLVNRDADNPRWREALRYAEAQSAMEQAKWTRAQEILHEIVKERPDYKDAARLLAEAIAASRGEKKRLVTLPRWAWVTGIVIVAILLLLGGILIGQKILTLTPTSVTPAGKTPAQASTITPTETATRALIVTPIPSPTAAATGAPTSTPSSTPTAIATDTPTPTDRPTRTPTPTVTPTHTSAPTDTPTQSPTHTATPTASPPEPVVPEQGHTYKNPVTFQWSGFLRSGQEYQVIARHPGSGDSIESELLTNPNWEFNLPGEKYGEWRWKVLVMQEGRIVATSPEWMFWFRPDGPAPTEGPPSTNTPPPTP
jgi:tetratricopeptide (TPR) repeat protein